MDKTPNVTIQNLENGNLAITWGDNSAAEIPAAHIDVLESAGFPIRGIACGLLVPVPRDLLLYVAEGHTPGVKQRASAEKYLAQYQTD